MLVDADGTEQAKKKIGIHRYMTTEYGDYKTDPETAKYYIRLLTSDIKDILGSEMASRGVLSLAERWNCPLMWSHYANEHRGLCIEFDTSENACSHIKPVDYRQPRNIKLTDLVQWKQHQSAEAERHIMDTYFFAKAPQWRYEKEWRAIHHSNGTDNAPFRISGVYFGFRCDNAITTSIVKLFANSPVSPISFYDVHPAEDSFKLKRSRVDTAEIEACGVGSPLFMAFKPIYTERQQRHST